MSELMSDAPPPRPPDKTDALSEAPSEPTAPKEDLDPTAEAESEAPPEEDAVPSDVPSELVTPSESEVEAPTEDLLAGEGPWTNSPDETETVAPSEGAAAAEPVEAEPNEQQDLLDEARARVAPLIEQRDQVAAARNQVDEAYASVDDAAAGGVATQADDPSGQIADGASDDPVVDDRVPTGDARLDAAWDGSKETAAGRTLVGEHDKAYPFVDLPAPVDGQYTLVAHGDTEFVEATTPDGVVVLSPEDLGDLIRSDPKWDGQPVLLLSCDTGLSPGGGRPSVGQGVADRIDMPVTAPPGRAIIEETGVVYSSVQDNIYGSPVRDKGIGDWPVFYPRSNQEK